jgi:hypothetical protein
MIEILLACMVGGLYFVSGCMAVHSFYKTKDDPDVGSFDASVSTLLFFIATILFWVIVK